MITTTSQIAAPVQESFLHKMLSTPVPLAIFGTAAMKFTMPSQGGRIAKMRRAERLPVATVPLGNTGITPPAAVPEVTDISAEIQFYGNYIMLQEQVVLQNQDPTLNWMTEILGINLKETEDVLIRDTLAATAAQIDCGAGINGDNPTELTFDDILQTTQTLFNNNAKSIAMVVEGADKFGTAPVRNAFFALGSSQLQASLNNIDRFIPTAQYPNQSSVLVSEFGSVGYTRWLLSSNGSVTTNASALGNNVFNNFIVGMESYGTINQDNYSSKFLYIPPEIIGGPLALYGALGWKKAVANRILNDSWLYNLRCTIA